MSDSVTLMNDNIQTKTSRPTAQSLSDNDLMEKQYRPWKKNAPFLYDIVMTTVLDQVSLTVEWFPDVKDVDDYAYTTRRLLLGTQSADDRPNHIVIAEARIPKSVPSSQDGAYIQHSGKIEVTQEIIHPGDVHRARIMPHNANIIATKTSSSDVYIFDRTQHSSKPQRGAEPSPLLRLIGHTDGGYAISWNPNRHGQLISGSSDGLICMWDLFPYLNGQMTPPAPTSKQPSLQSKTPSIGPSSTYTSHTDVVEDVSFHPTLDYLFGSCGDDKRICLWDTRTSHTDKPLFTITNAHQREINSLSWNIYDDNIFATASSDHTVGLWDKRNLKYKLYSLEGHTDEVYNVQWSPFASNILSSSSNDRYINIWDISRIGDEQTTTDAAYGKPELIMVHAGHTDRINDFSWCPNRDWLAASVSDNDVLQVWEFATSIRDELSNNNNNDDDDENNITNDDDTGNDNNKLNIS